MLTTLGQGGPTPRSPVFVVGFGATPLPVGARNQPFFVLFERGSMHRTLIIAVFAATGLMVVVSTMAAGAAPEGDGCVEPIPQRSYGPDRVGYAMVMDLSGCDWWDGGQRTVGFSALCGPAADCIDLPADPTPALGAASDLYDQIGGGDRDAR